MKKKLVIVAGVLLVGGVLAGHVNFQSFLRLLLEKIQDLGPLAPLIFVLTYILATVLFLPGWILTFGGGALFGVLRGTVYVSLGSVLGASAAFLAGRYLAQGWVNQRLEKYPKFSAISRAVGREGWKIVGLTRLSPVLPFNLLNYAFGITSVSFKDYFLASWIGMLPWTVVYVYIGSLAGDLAGLGTGQRTRTTVEWILYGVGLIATFVLSIYITRIARRAIEKKGA